MTKQKRRGLIIMLGALSAIGPFSIDMYLPGFTKIAADLGTSVAAVGYTLTSYFLGIAFGQLIYGPLSDRYGRKRPLVAGLLLYLVATAVCILSPSLAWLIGARLLMALGACVGMVVGRAIVRDLFPVRETAAIFSTFMLIISVSPIFAPSVGGYLASGLGWRYIFVALGTIAAVILAVVLFRLPESKATDPSISLRPDRMALQYLEVIREPRFLTYAIAGGLGSGGLFAYLSGAPVVFLRLFGLTQAQFSGAFAAIAMGLISGSQLNRLLLKRYSSRSITAVCVGAQVVLGGLLSIGALTHRLPLPDLFALVLSFLFATGLVNPNTAALALEPFSANAGSASALLGCIQMGIGALASGLVSLFASVSSLPMVGVMWATALASGALLLAFGRNRRVGADELSAR